MTVLPSDNIGIVKPILVHKSLCALCQNDYSCRGHSQFTKESIFYNFDQITKIIYKHALPRSADAFYLKNDKIYFIEIKDRKVDDLILKTCMQTEIVEKLLDSVYTVWTNPRYFKNFSIDSFILLFSHLKRKGDASTRINLRGLGNTRNITITSDSVKIPIRAINLYSTHIRKHHRETLTEPKEIMLNFKLKYCDTINKDVLEE